MTWNSKYPLYTGGGVCDVCNAPLNDLKAYVVPNHIFYKSPQWRAHFKKVTSASYGFPMPDSEIERMAARDKSPGSAVCEHCLHMFQ